MKAYLLKYSEEHHGCDGAYWETCYHLVYASSSSEAVRKLYNQLGSTPTVEVVTIL